MARIDGSSTQDFLVGTAGDDQIWAFAGDDWVRGGAGAELIDGGAGRDTAVYDTSEEAIDINLSRTALQLGGDAEGDVLRGIENIVGSQHDDRITGDSRANTLTGGAGADILDGQIESPGSTDNSDRASYSGSSAAVQVDLRLGGPQSGGDAEGDLLRNIENLTGSRFDDVLIGNAENNVLNGGRGADVLDGGTGRDVAEYSGSFAGIDVDLTRAVQIGGYAEGDQLRGIEGVYGSDHDDRITGDAGDNTLSGAGGDDVIKGGGGFDRINGGAGNDLIEISGLAHVVGGDGHDTLHIDLQNDPAADMGGRYASLNTNGTLTMSRWDGMGQFEAQTATGIEQLHYDGWDGYDNVYGRDDNDVIFGHGGGDSLGGGGGSDYIDGGDGNDLIWGDRASASLSGPIGADTLIGGAGDDWIQANIAFNRIEGGEGYDAATITSAREQGSVTVDLRAAGEIAARITGIEHFEVIASEGNDTIFGSALADGLGGGSGNDVVYGGAGNDLIRGGSGDDELHGDDGNDLIFGGIGSTMPEGYDKLFGGAGDDIFQVDQFDFDLVDGGDGVDILRIGMQRTGHFVIDATNTDPTLGGIIRNVEGLDISENPTGVTYGSYDVTGTDYADRFVAQWANRGQMTFHGRGGDDVAVGGGGDDLLDGGSGSDTITGGSGADTFQVQSWLTSEHDVITDFWHGDKLSFTAHDQSVIHDFDDFLAHATQTEAGVLVALADDPNYTGNLLLNGTTLADFDPSNVLFT